MPAVFDYLKPDGYFKKHESDISDINVAIHDLQNDERMKQIKTEIDFLKARWQRDIDAYQLQMKTAKAQRDARRKVARAANQDQHSIHPFCTAPRHTGPRSIAAIPRPDARRSAVSA